RTAAIQSAPRPPLADASELGAPPSVPSAALAAHAGEPERDTGIDFGWLGDKPAFATTIRSAAALDSPPPPRGWPRRALRTLARSAGPLLVAVVMTIVALWPRLRSFAEQRIDRLELSASHCIGSFSTYPAVSMSHQVGTPRGDYWNLYTNGWIAQQHEFSTGDAEVRVSAGADPAGEDPAHMLVSVDDVV